jgi:hypothetical protein
VVFYQRGAGVFAVPVNPACTASDSKIIHGQYNVTVVRIESFPMRVRPARVILIAADEYARGLP